MNLLISKKTQFLQGEITIPGSKSEAVRALLLSTLAEGTSVIENVYVSDDILAALSVCRSLGADIHFDKNCITVQSQGMPLQTPLSTTILTGNSGITTLFSIPIVGLRKNGDEPIIINCHEQMRRRPILPLLTALKSLGLKIKFLQAKNFLPVEIRGQLLGGQVEIDGLNSQYTSALLLALPCARNDSIIKIKNLHEKPYVNMTLEFLKMHQIKFKHQSDNHSDIFEIQGNQLYQPLHYKLQGDFSTASTLITAAALIPNNLKILGLDLSSRQGDQRLLSILEDMGAEFTYNENYLQVKSNQLNAVTVDANDIPDLLPALAVLGTKAQGLTEILNVPQARIKETDRIHSMTTGLTQMNAIVEEYNDGLRISHNVLRGALVDGFKDHRTVMALSVAGLTAEHSTLISDADAINKTFPQFITALKKCGARLKLINQYKIMIIGFKHAGKTTLAKKLSEIFNLPFYDLDEEIEKKYLLSSREIVQTKGETVFRQYETDVLSTLAALNSGVFALGGGTALNNINHCYLEDSLILHIHTDREIIFDRILKSGIPAFFNSENDPRKEFDRLFEERMPVYFELADYSIKNNDDIYKLTRVLNA